MESVSESKLETLGIFEEIRKAISESGIAELRKEIQNLKDQIKEKDELIEKLLVCVTRKMNL
jgi:hypothetical protein|tara:strand:- start:199 stop:384 length:186 start_codon:yes stop_codon:yes gene_type:complete